MKISQLAITKRSFITMLAYHVRNERAIGKLLGRGCILTLQGNIRHEWTKFRLRCRAVNRACREVCNG